MRYFARIVFRWLVAADFDHTGAINSVLSIPVEQISTPVEPRGRKTSLVMWNALTGVIASFNWDRIYALRRLPWPRALAVSFVFRTQGRGSRDFCQFVIRILVVFVRLPDLLA
jgi:hypothetical protein